MQISSDATGVMQRIARVCLRQPRIDHRAVHKAIKAECDQQATIVGRRLSALVSSERIRLKQTSETVCADGRVPDEMRERVSDCGADN